MTTGLYLLRARELGLSWQDLDEMDEGEFYDMLIERANDSYEYPVKGTGTEFRALFGR